ncbi:DUF1553 domain-containing protein [Rubinisphaera sp. JC750]|uniref:DUF1553 domain-containing protein n=1 Tax=Rubinisphaera sp. JC750 TaxID=2898658 RepID=UPI001F20CACA|nr:DUF1553 domain-containing protein [Rubinisphaera sp. JC750]
MGIPVVFARVSFAFCTVVAAGLSCSSLALNAAEPNSTPPASTESTPALALDFEDKAPSKQDGSGLEIVDQIEWNAAGPRPDEYPDFKPSNKAAKFAGNGGRIIAHHGEAADNLQFRQGDQITIEAWIRPEAHMKHSFPYIIGKGRTQRAGFHPLNQNFALRLVGGKGSGPMSFFFVDEDVKNGGSAESNGHRWTSNEAVPYDGAWHHVAIVYEFGKPESIKGYVDGKPTDGHWDLAGATTKAPIVDEDQTWIGASGRGSNGFSGSIDELKVHRRIVPSDTLKARYRHNYVDRLQLLVEEQNDAAGSGVFVDVHESLPASRSWKFNPTPGETVFETDAFAVTRLPNVYTSRGIIDDRKGPLLVHLHSKITLPPGKYELVLRALNSARLYVDGKVIGSTDFMGLHSSAHGDMHDLKQPEHGELSLPVAHAEKRIEFESDGKPHQFSLLTISGHRSLPMTLGELTVAVGQPGKQYYLLGSSFQYEFTDAGWIAFQAKEQKRLNEWNAELRHRVSAEERAEWEERHAAARKWLKTQPEITVPDAGRNHPIDQFISAELQAETDLKPTELVDDYTFLRRVSLDLIGLNPTPEQIAQFFADPAETRRAQAVDRLLADPSWADNWIPYWQDVLAENPGLTKPMLNNSGPFRWYLHEAFRDNRSFDRIATEIILMEGSRLRGGTAGFAIASNNDVPMAAKAHIVGTAFLGTEMKCARCHDAPYHDLAQRDLFQIAAMLKRDSVAVPATSSIPGTPEQLAEMVVQVTLKPGEKVQPQWPFHEFLDQAAIDEISDSKDSRATLAELVTSPRNERFAQVIANRVWKRLIGRGIVEPVEDWETGEPSHPELMKWLGRKFTEQGYDLKELTRTIVSSDLYQQKVVTEFEQEQFFAGPTRRRMTAEQLVDTVYMAVGKPLPCEPLTYNADGRQSASVFNNFGVPKRAWEWVAISNERERPSMNLPKAQSVADLLAAFGWRSERQDPTTVRELTPTPLTPLALANGAALNRAVDVSDRGELVDLCLSANSVDSLIDKLFLRVLSRPPRAEERAIYTELLTPGFENRKTGVKDVPEQKVFRSPLTWTAHFDPDASLEGIRQTEQVEQGDAPTERLTRQWREQFEDATWVLFNSPEFVFVP